MLYLHGDNTFLAKTALNNYTMNTWKENALCASRKLNLVSTQEINHVLLALASKAEEKCDDLLAENQKDLAAMEKSNPLYDRLLLTKQRIYDIASDIRKVASLPSPVGNVLESRELPNGLKLTKKAVPFGVIGIIYEARPNVSFDVFSLCFKTGNVCVLKGGTDAYNSNFAIVSLIKEVLKENNCRNIAITGTYGSGKSSIIRTLQNEVGREYNFVNISLSTLDTNAQDIESSIVQQLLYKTDSNKSGQYRYIKPFILEEKELNGWITKIALFITAICILFEPNWLQIDWAYALYYKLFGLTYGYWLNVITDIVALIYICYFIII